MRSTAAKLVVPRLQDHVGHSDEDKDKGGSPGRRQQRMVEQVGSEVGMDGGLKHDPNQPGAQEPLERQLRAEDESGSDPGAECEQKNLHDSHSLA
jgi:hypothetical protein